MLSSSGLLEHNEDQGEHDRSPGVGVGGGDLDALPAVGVWNKPITIAAQKRWTVWLARRLRLLPEAHSELTASPLRILLEALQ